MGQTDPPVGMEWLVVLMGGDEACRKRERGGESTTVLPREVEMNFASAARETVKRQAVVANFI